MFYFKSLRKIFTAQIFYRYLPTSRKNSFFIFLAFLIIRSLKFLRTISFDLIFIRSFFNFRIFNNIFTLLLNLIYLILRRWWYLFYWILIICLENILSDLILQKWKLALIRWHQREILVCILENVHLLLYHLHLKHFHLFLKLWFGLL